ASKKPPGYGPCRLLLTLVVLPHLTTCAAPDWPQRARGPLFLLNSGRRIGWQLVMLINVVAKFGEVHACGCLERVPPPAFPCRTGPYRPFSCGPPGNAYAMPGAGQHV